MLESAKVIGIIVTVLSSAISVTDKKIILFFRKKEAIDPKTASKFIPANFYIRWRLKRILCSGILLKTGPDIYFFDKRIYLLKKKNRRVRVLIIVGLIVLVAFMVIFF